MNSGSGRFHHFLLGAKQIEAKLDPTCCHSQFLLVPHQESRGECATPSCTVIGRTIHAGMAWFAAKKCNFPDQKGHLHSRLSKVSCTPKWPSRRPLRVTLPRAHATVHSRGAFATLGRQWWASDTAEVPKNAIPVRVHNTFIHCDCDEDRPRRHGPIFGEKNAISKNVITSENAILGFQCCDEQSVLIPPRARNGVFESLAWATNFN